MFLSSSRDKFTFLWQMQRQMFLLVSGRLVAVHTDGLQHGLSTQIAINLPDKTFLRISWLRKSDLNLGEELWIFTFFPYLDCGLYLFSVFMWRNHIPKFNFTFPSQVLVSSDKRPYRNLTYHNVSARQGSSYCSRVRLNFQAFALRDMKIATLELRLSRRSKDELSL